MAKPQSHTRGGCGLSLEKFAGAKLSTHNKQQAEEKRQALTAGRINNFRKLKKQLARQSLAAAPSSPSDAQQSAPARMTERTQPAATNMPENRQPGEEEPLGLAGQEKRRKRKHKSRMHRLAEQAEQDQVDREAARQSADRAAEQQQQRRQQVEQQRRQQTQLMRKRTRTGQPVMKHRIDHILDQLHSALEQ